MAITQSDKPHIPVLIEKILTQIAPVSGRWLDGTFGAGGYTRALLEAGAEKVFAVDRDPAVFDMPRAWPAALQTRLEFIPGLFSKLDDYAQELDGIVLDLGVSSMQLDQAERGFSFMRDGPLDMRMSQSGPSAADLVNGLPEADIANLLYLYGEERASRRIAKSIVQRRSDAVFKTTLDLAQLIEKALPRTKPGQSHAATRSFQALRIHINRELGEIEDGLAAAEAMLKPGGILAVVSFHSLEDRIVKRFLASRSQHASRPSRHRPVIDGPAPSFEIISRKAILPIEHKRNQNSRARSAKLRVARRTGAPPDSGPSRRRARHDDSHKSSATGSPCARMHHRGAESGRTVWRRQNERRRCGERGAPRASAKSRAPDSARAAIVPRAGCRR